MLERAGLRIPTAGVDAGLFATILIAYFVPVSALLAESRAERVAAAVAVLCSPVFFASILFIRTFAAARFSGAALLHALGVPRALSSARTCYAGMNAVMAALTGRSM